MIDDDALRALDAAQWTPQFIKPLYESYCFAQLPQLVLSLFAGTDNTGVTRRLLGPLAGRYDKVILFFVDAFGWRFFERYHADYPFLDSIVRDGVVTKLTSQFPSTTAAHVTAIHTGLPVGQSGVYEWFYYEPLVDALIAPLMYSFAGDRARDTLCLAPITPEALYPRQTIYQDLYELGVRSFLFQHKDYTPSPYSDVVFKGAEVMGYHTLPEALVTLTHLLLNVEGPAYFFLYFDKVDSACHRHGPGSLHAEAEIDTFLITMERLLQRRLAGRLTATLFMMTADHGQVEIDPATTIYLNKSLPGVQSHLRCNAKGQLLVPAGSPRDMFLHIKDGQLDEALDYLQRNLEGRADVCRVADLIAQGFFGPGAPSSTFLSRVGDLVILPYKGESVWWYERGRYEQGYYGHHGGLTREEMETLLLARQL